MRVVVGFSAQPLTTLDRWMSDDTCGHPGLQATIRRAHRGLRHRALERGCVITGECRVEGIPPRDPALPSKPKLALDGLRLQLDLRIVPGTEGGEAAAAAVWRIESESAATMPLGAPTTLRRAAVAAGVAVLVGALGVWFLTAPRAPTDERGRAEPAAPHAPVASAGGASSRPTARAAPPAPHANGSIEPSVAPRITTEPGGSGALTPSDERPSSAPPSARPAPHAVRDPSLVPPPPAPARAAEQRPGHVRPATVRAEPNELTTARAGTAARVPPGGDMLELFEDTK